MKRTQPPVERPGAGLLKKRFLIFGPIIPYDHPCPCDRLAWNMTVFQPLPRYMRGFGLDVELRVAVPVQLVENLYAPSLGIDHEQT